jgi:hypothetical protein
MISSEVQRTLVKSPPELWAELSDPSALARHLGELGDIRITHIEPETAVEWEAEDASGTVRLKPSGWGTKVTLTVNRELPEPAPDVAEAQSPIAHEPTAQPVSTPQGETEPPPHVDVEPSLHLDPEPALEPEPEPETEPAWELEAEPAVEAEHLDPPPAPADAWADYEPAPAPESRRGFFARLFRRREREAPIDALDELAATIRPPEANPDWAASVEYLSEPPWAVATPHPQPEPLNPLEQEMEAHEHAAPVEAIESDEPIAHDGPGAHHEHVAHDWPVAHDEPVAHEEPAQSVEPADSEDDEPADLSAELKAAEEATVEQVTAVLTGVLDRLGAAHHRPFSRS